MFRNFLIAAPHHTRIILFQKLPSPTPTPTPAPESENAPVLYSTRVPTNYS